MNNTTSTRRYREVLTVLFICAFSTLFAQGWVKQYNQQYVLTDSDFEAIYDDNDIYEAEDGSFVAYVFVPAPSLYKERLYRISQDGEIMKTSPVLDSFTFSKKRKYIMPGDNGEIVVFSSPLNSEDSLYIWKLDYDFKVMDFKAVPFRPIKKVTKDDEGNFSFFWIGNSPNSSIERYFITKINSLGETLASDSIDLLASLNLDNIDDIKITKANDGGHYLTILVNAPNFGGTDRLYFYKFTADNQLEWQNDYSSPYYSVLGRYHQVEAVNIGSSLYVESLNKLFKLNSTGDIVWSMDSDKRIAASFFFERMQATPDGNLLMLGCFNGNANTMAMLVDTNGVALSGKKFCSSSNPNACFYLWGTFTMKPIRDGGSIAVMRTSDHLVLAKIDRNGGTDLHLLQGRLVADLNQNCHVETGEPGLANVKVKLGTNGRETFLTTDSTGHFRIAVQAGELTLEARTTAIYHEPCDSIIHLTIAPSTVLDTTIVEIPVKLLGNCPIMSVEINAPFYRRCFDNKVQVHYCNIGNVVAEDVEVKVYFSQGYSLVSAGWPIASQGQGWLSFFIGDLQPGECGVIPIAYHIGCEAELGQNWCISADVRPHDTCFPLPDYLENDPLYFERNCMPVRGSFDPNDKQAQPVGFGSQHYITNDTLLTYLIRFQNTGTDTAFKVVIIDTLSLHLDPLTVIPGASSHPYTFSLRDDGVLRFIFDEIMLPDSNVNEPASHGFVQFKIAQRHTSEASLKIENAAAIYFDYNAPVITNTVTHTTWDDTMPLEIGILSNKCDSMELSLNLPALQHQWSNGDTTETAIVTTPGWVYLTIITPVGTIKHDSIFADVLVNDIQLNAIVTSPPCHDAQIGKIDLQPTSASAQTWNYEWNNGSTNQDLNNLPAGTYRVTVTGSLGCSTIEEFPLINPPAIEVVAQVNDVSCLDESDGSIQLTGYGGTGSYTWNWAIGQTTNELNNIPAGSYYWNMHDSNFCWTNGTVDVGTTQPPILIHTSVHDATCYGKADGAVAAIFEAYDGSFSVVWSNGAVGDSINGLASGSYGLELQYGDGCVLSYENIVQINEPSELVVLLLGTNSTAGQSNGSILATPNGGTPPYSYLWSTGTSDATALNLSAGTYSLTVTDANDCKAINQIILDEISTLGQHFSSAGIINFPNPVHDLMHVHINSQKINSINSVKVYNSLGQVIRSAIPLMKVGSGKISFEISTLGWPGGFYHLEIVTGNGDRITLNFLKM